MRIFKRTSYIGLFFLLCLQSRAALISQVDLGTGFSTLRLNSADYTGNLTGGVSLEVNYVLKQVSISSAYTLSFYEVLRAGAIPFTRLSAGYRFYPRGINGGRMILDQGSEAQIWKPTPYAGFSVGFANVSIEQFNASLIDISPSFGAELPLTTRLLLQAQLSINTGSSMTASEAKKISYQGITALVGVILTDR